MGKQSKEYIHLGTVEVYGDQFVVGNPYYLLRAERDEGHNRSWQPTFEQALTLVESARSGELHTSIRDNPIGVIVNGVAEGRYNVIGRISESGQITEVTISQETADFPQKVDDT